MARPNLVLNINELRNVIALVTELGRDPAVRASLAELRNSGTLLVPSAHAKLVPANQCVHTLSTPDSLKQRWTSQLSAGHICLTLRPENAVLPHRIADRKPKARFKQGTSLNCLNRSSGLLQNKLWQAT